jgi:hypothetical protein
MSSLWRPWLVAGVSLGAAVLAVKGCPTTPYSDLTPLVLVMATGSVFSCLVALALMGWDFLWGGCGD